MATAQTLINRALRLNGRLGAGRSPSVNETADCLESLNAMLDSWRTERLATYAMAEQTLTLVAGTASYTIGSGGDLDTTRPVKIEDAFMRENNIDYPVEIIDEKRWNALSVKTTTSNIIDCLYYSPTMSTGTLNLYPTPSATNVLHLTLWVPLTAFAAATTTVSLPPGYERALAFNLAVEITDEYGTGITERTLQVARESKAAIKRVNLPSARTLNPLRHVLPHGRVNIESDGA